MSRIEARRRRLRELILAVLHESPDELTAAQIAEVIRQAYPSRAITKESASQMLVFMPHVVRYCFDSPNKPTRYGVIEDHSSSIPTATIERIRTAVKIHPPTGDAQDILGAQVFINR